MISDDVMFMYLIFQMIFLVIGFISYTKIPYLGIVVTIGVFATAYQTIIAFGDYWMMGLMLIICNMMIPILSFDKVGVFK